LGLTSTIATDLTNKNRSIWRKKYNQLWEHSLYQTQLKQSICPK